jgi:lipid-A-disaccharide synthase
LNLLISAGEASGDLHGARLLRALRALRPGLTAFGMGGERLEAAGLERLVRCEEVSVVGISEVVEKLPALWRSLGTLRDAARRRRPEAAILVDFPDFHGLLSKRLRRDGIPVIYYVSPQVWAWRGWRAHAIARRARRIITLFPFEVEIYRRLGADAVCAGHPLVEDVKEGLSAPSPLPKGRRRRLVLLPGSRSAELRRHWPAMRAAAARLARRFDLEVVAIRAPSLPASLFEGASGAGIRVIDGPPHPLLSRADLAFVASGTATLEAALCGTPMVVVYRTSAVSHAIARALVRLRWISLVNIVADREVVPEILQDRLTPGNLEQAGAGLLESPERAEAMREDLARVSAALGAPGASERAARYVLEALDPEAALPAARGGRLAL